MSSGGGVGAPGGPLRACRSFAVLSPHLDDAALSLGATIAQRAAAGTEVTVITVFGGDPAVRGPAGEWDRRCGFESVQEATAARRAEERAACQVLGARGVQLPFGDEQYAISRDEDAIWAAVLESLRGVQAVLLPGAPLAQADHRWVTSTALERLGGDLELGFFVEQPYAMWESMDPATLSVRMRVRAAQLLRRPAVREHQRLRLEPTLAARGEERWELLPVGLHARWRKLQALRCYRSQLRGFGRDFIPQIMLYEWADGGEPIGWTRPGHSIPVSGSK